MGTRGVGALDDAAAAALVAFARFEALVVFVLSFGGLSSLDDCDTGG